MPEVLVAPTVAKQLEAEGLALEAPEAEVGSKSSGAPAQLPEQFVPAYVAAPLLLGHEPAVSKDLLANAEIAEAGIDFRAADLEHLEEGV